jgi:MSHA pilin protein MshC
MAGRKNAHRMTMPACAAGRNSNRARRSGFTLIEILSVVIILGIASAIIVPQISTRNDLQAAAGARAVMADLLYAQNRAIATQQMCYVKFDVVNQQYGVYSSMSPLTVLMHPVNAINYIMTFGGVGPNALNGVVLTSASFGGGSSTIGFDEMGSPYYYSGATATLLSGTGTIVVTSGNYPITINIAQDTGDITTTP